MPSIKDVARLAGVSIATVSRAVNNLDVVSEETRRKIAWAVKRLGYNPNLAARSLKRRSAKLLGLLVPDIENPYYATLAKHMEAEASSAGYSLILCNTGGLLASEEHYLKLLAGRLVDGVFVCRGGIRDASAHGGGGKKVKLVMLEKNSERDRRPAVMVDNVLVGQLAARHFLDNGHVRLACVMDRKAVLPFARRLRGFVEAAAAGGVRVAPAMLVEAGSHISDGQAAMRGLMRLGGDKRPTAVYCTNDILAMGAMQAVFEAGLRIPEDVSVVGTDDVAQSSFLYPPLTTVGQPFAEIAKAAMAMLLGGDGEESDVLLRPILRVRESSGPAPVATPREGRRRSGKATRRDRD